MFFVKPAGSVCSRWLVAPKVLLTRYVLLEVLCPSAKTVAVRVGNGVVPINIQVQYLQGGSFKAVTQ